MRPEPFAAFHAGLRFGPGRCPPDLFEGSVTAIVRGLKVHANNITRARHVALEETYPRLVERMGPEPFRQAARVFLDNSRILGRSLDTLGFGFEQGLAVAAHRDLARVEWAWIETFHAAEADSLDLAALSEMTPEHLANASFALHPATRCVALEDPDAFEWNCVVSGEGPHVLLTRPGAEMMLRRIHFDPAAALASGEDPSSLITLIDAGAVRLEDMP